MCVLVEEELLKDVANKLTGLVPASSRELGFQVSDFAVGQQTNKLTIASLQSCLRFLTKIQLLCLQRFLLARLAAALTGASKEAEFS